MRQPHTPALAPALAAALSLAAIPSFAQQPALPVDIPVDLARPQLVLQQTVQGMPRGAKQEIRVLTANFKPGDQTPFHTHRSPVTVYVLEGTFTLELEGRAPVTVKTGEAYVEPPNVKMTGFNRSTDKALRVLIFYVSEPGAPFLDPMK